MSAKIYLNEDELIAFCFGYMINNEEEPMKRLINIKKFIREEVHLDDVDRSRMEEILFKYVYAPQLNQSCCIERVFK